MRKLTAIILFLTINIFCFASTDDKSTVINKSALTTHNIQKGNYQKFKSDFTNINLSKTNDFSHIGRGRSDNKLMLYVAGGIALGTTSLVLINKPGNSAMENPQQANTGVIIGGVIATGMIITKYFLDKNRR